MRRRRNRRDQVTKSVVNISTGEYHQLIRLWRRFLQRETHFGLKIFSHLSRKVELRLGNARSHKVPSSWTNRALTFARLVVREWLNPWMGFSVRICTLDSWDLDGLHGLDALDGLGVLRPTDQPASRWNRSGDLDKVNGETNWHSNSNGSRESWESQFDLIKCKSTCRHRSYMTERRRNENFPLQSELLNFLLAFELVNFAVSMKTDIWDPFQWNAWDFCNGVLHCFYHFETPFGLMDLNLDSNLNWFLCSKRREIRILFWFASQFVDTIFTLRYL